ncbi:hypothetical protein Hanom_Chr15g01399201 [Helianthus anomalus]
MLLKFRKKRGIQEIHGREVREDISLDPVSDADLWERAQGRSGFGIGSSDTRFIVNGTPSSSSGSHPILTSSARKSMYYYK